MAKKKNRLRLGDNREYLAAWIDREDHDALMERAYNEGRTLSDLVRNLVKKELNIANENNLK